MATNHPTNPLGYILKYWRSRRPLPTHSDRSLMPHCLPSVREAKPVPMTLLNIMTLIVLMPAIAS